MSQIDYCVPTHEIYEVINEYHLAFDKKAIEHEERVGFIIGTFYKNAEILKAKGIDFWLSFGGTLPAVERVIALHNGESEQDFYARTQYPKHVVEAYSIIDEFGEYDDFGTLVVGDIYKNGHMTSVPANTAVWELSDDEFIDLAQFEQRLCGI